MKINQLRTAFAAVLFGLVLILGGQSAKAETKDVSGTARYDHAFQVLELVNQERAKVGAEPLEMDEELLSAAMLRAAETVVNFNHTRPNGERCFTASSKMSGGTVDAFVRTQGEHFKYRLSINRSWLYCYLIRYILGTVLWSWYNAERNAA